MFLAEATIATIARTATQSTQSGVPLTATSSATSNTTTSQQTMSRSQTLLSPTSTNTISSSSSPAPYPSSPTAAPVPKASKHSNHTVILGSSISFSIAAVILGCGVFACFWIRRRPPQKPRRRQRQQQHKDPEMQGNRTAEGNPASEAATNSDEGESTLIGSHGQTSTPSLNTSNATRDAVELGSSTIHQLASMPSPRLAPSPISELDTYSHPSLAQSPLSTQVRDNPPQSYPTPVGFPPTSRSAYRTPELESAFDVAPIHPRFRPPSPSPASIELEARDGVTISTLYNVASGSPRNRHGFRAAPPTHGSPLSMILQSPHSSTFPREESEAGSRVELSGTSASSAVVGELEGTSASSTVVGESEGSRDQRRPPTPVKPPENGAPQARAASGSVSPDVEGQTEGRRNSGEVGEGSQYRGGGRNGYRVLDSEGQPDSPSSVLEGEARNWANWF